MVRWYTDRRRLYLVILLCAVLGGMVHAQQNVILRGAGATFPNLLYQKWIDFFQREFNHRISYVATGSSDGIEQILSREVDFGASDAFMTDSEATTLDSELIHIPTCMGAVAIVYNLPAVENVQLTPEIISRIFLGEVTNWNHKELSRHNSAFAFPKQPITVIHRSEGSGTNFVFTDYLSNISASWEQNVGRGKSVRWKTGIGVEGNKGICTLVERIEGSIGYVELSHAVQNNMQMAAVLNKSGKFIQPSLYSVTAAADMTLPDDCRIMITNTNAPEGYPISTFTYLMVYKEQAYNNRLRYQAQGLIDFLRWALHDGQLYPASLMYAPLPDKVVRTAMMQVRSITYNGQSILEQMESYE